MFEDFADRELFNTSTIFALLIRCPMGIDANEECPFARFRESKDLEEKYHIANSMEERLQAELLENHKQCFENMSLKAIYMNTPFSRERKFTVIGNELVGTV